MRRFVVAVASVLIVSGLLWAGSNTSRLSLYKPDPGETGWAALVNANFDTLDNSCAVAPTIDDQLCMASGTEWEGKTLPNCTDTGGNHLNYTTATNTFSCGTSSSGSGGAGVFLHWTANQAFLPASSFPQHDTRNTHPVLDFDASADECAYFGGVLGNDYAGGGLTIDVFWMATSATSGSVTWLVSVERHQIDTDDLDSDSFVADNSATCTTATASGEVDLCTITFTDGADMDSVAAGEPFRLRVCRDGDGSVGTDDMTGDAELKNLTMRET